jgi:hypothetical protein
MDERTHFVGQAARILLVGLIAASLVTALVKAPGTFDDYAFVQWGKTLVLDGPFEGYGLLRHQTELNYPPLGLFIIWLSLVAGHAAGLSDLLSFKLPLAMGGLAAIPVAWWCNRSADEALLLTLIITPFGLILGYTDVVYLSFLLAALYAGAAARFAVAGLALAVAALIKWQPIVLAPIFLLAAFRARRSFWDLGVILAPTAVLVGLVLAVFGPVACFDVFITATKDEYVSGQGANAGWLLSYVFEVLHVDGLRLQPNGMVAILQTPSPAAVVAWAMLGLRIVFYLLFAASLGIYMAGRRTGAAFLTSALSCCVVQFSWNSGVHENHFFPSMVIAFAGWQMGVVDRFVFAAVAAVAVLNVMLFYGLGDGFSFGDLAGFDGTVLLAAAELVLFGLVFELQIRTCLGGELAGKGLP